MSLLPTSHRSGQETASPPDKPSSDEPAERHRNNPPAERPVPEPAPRLTRVLVADDDAAILTIMEKILRAAGYGVGTAGDGEAAWEAFCAEGFDVVITDHDMPRLSGLDLLRRLRRREHHVPVVFISGNMPWGETDLPQLLSPGATLQKPFTGFELLATLRGVSTGATNSRLAGDEQTRLEFDRD